MSPNDTLKFRIPDTITEKDGRKIMDALKPYNAEVDLVRMRISVSVFMEDPSVIIKEAEECGLEVIK